MKVCRGVIRATWFFTVGAVIAWFAAASHGFEGVICYGGNAALSTCDGVGFEGQTVLWLAPVVILACAAVRGVARRMALKIITAGMRQG